MLHVYKKKTTIKAEQFDGSLKQITKYKVHIVGPTSFGDASYCTFPQKKAIWFSMKVIGLLLVLMVSIGPLLMIFSTGHTRGATDE